MEDRIGEEGRGFEYILEGMNPERVPIAAEAVGLRKLALSRAAEYAKTRIVFDRPIGKKGHPTSPGEELDGAGGRLAHGDVGGLAV